MARKPKPPPAPLFWRGIDLTQHVCGKDPDQCRYEMFRVPVCLSAYSRAAVRDAPPLTPTQIAIVRTLLHG